MSFWEEIQKQYQNAENRYRENLNTGINLMTNKANMMQQMFSNQMQSLGTQANMLGQSLQLPAQFTQMLANIDESARDRAMRERQFNKEYELNRDKFNADTNYQNKSLAQQGYYQSGVLGLERDKFNLTKSETERLKKLESKEREAETRNVDYELNRLAEEYPLAQQRYFELYDQFKGKASDKQILEWIRAEGVAGKLSKAPSLWDRIWNGK